MDTSGVIDQPSAGAATEKTSTESTGQGDVASQGSQGQEPNGSGIAGDSQGSSESGRDEGTDTRRPQFRSKNQTIYELRQKLRERDSYWENELGTLKQQIAEFQKMFGREQDRKPSRTFWEAPEEVLEERLQNHMTAMEERLHKRWMDTQTQSQETAEWKQETSEAAKFIRGQKAFTEDDILEVSTLIREDPVMERLRPMERAKYALFLFEQQKGVTDKSALKAKAAGAPVTAPDNRGPRMWTEAEMEAEYRKLGDPKHWDAEIKKKASALEREFMNAYTEKRVKRS